VTAERVEGELRQLNRSPAAQRLQVGRRTLSSYERRC
jgi:hypothetical protein